MLTRRNFVAGTLGTGLLLGTRNVHALPQLIPFAIVSAGIMIASLIQRAVDRRAWGALMESEGNWGRLPGGTLSHKREYRQAMRRMWKAANEPVHSFDEHSPEISVQDWFHPRAGMLREHQSETAVGSILANLSKTMHHEYKRGDGLNEAEALGIGQRFARSELALAPTSHRRFPFALQQDREILEFMRLSGKVLSGATPLYARDFVDQAGIAYVGFLVPSQFMPSAHFAELEHQADRTRMPREIVTGADNYVVFNLKPGRAKFSPVSGIG